jgi:hypothetical protein
MGNHKRIIEATEQVHDISNWYFHQGKLCGDRCVNTSPLTYQYNQYLVLGQPEDDIVYVRDAASKIEKVAFRLDHNKQDRYFAEKDRRISSR